MDKGAFQTSREIFDNPIWQNIVEFRLFFLIYGKAMFSDEGSQQGDVRIGKGQWLRSYRNLQADLEYIENRSVKRYSLSRIKRAVDGLIKDERIKIEHTELGTLFTVLNYARYQGLDNYKRHNENAERTQRERRENGDGTEMERRWNNNKNDKNDKNDKDILSDDSIPKKEKKSSAKFNYEPEHMELAELLYSEILKNNPKYKKPNLESWADTIRLATQRDNRTYSELETMIKWCQADSFWYANILSADKLRKQYDQLYSKMQQQNSPKPNKSNSRTIKIADF